MATVWLKNKCPMCKKPVVGGGVLLAMVKYTDQDTYQSYGSGPGKVRPNFQSKQPRVAVHPECLPDEMKRILGLEVPA